jgi:hypothetical protein
MSHRVTAWLTTVLVPLAGGAVHAHHSYTEFAQDQTVEIEGRLAVAKWQNPHSLLEVRVVDATGATVVWDIETGPVNGFLRREVPLDTFRVGEGVKIAGWPSKRSPARLHATNLRGVGGPEVVIMTGKPLWGGTVLYGGGPPPTATAARPVAAGERPTLFRVWVSDVAVEPESRNGFLSRADVSLTEAAQRAVAAFDPVSQSTTDLAGCAPKAFPLLMGQPFPIEFIDRGDSIVLRLEEYDAVRTIHMAPSAVPPAGRSPLGYSVGRWEGDTLVVETDRIDAPYFNATGVPLGENPRAVERFTVRADGQRLGYTITVTDPEVFTAPATAQRAWVAKDGVRLLAYDCQPPSVTQL